MCGGKAYLPAAMAKWRSPVAREPTASPILRWTKDARPLARLDRGRRRRAPRPTPAAGRVRPARALRPRPRAPRDARRRRPPPTWARSRRRRPAAAGPPRSRRACRRPARRGRRGPRSGCARVRWRGRPGSRRRRRRRSRRRASRDPSRRARRRALLRPCACARASPGARAVSPAGAAPWSRCPPRHREPSSTRRTVRFRPVAAERRPSARCRGVGMSASREVAGGQAPAARLSGSADARVKGTLPLAPDGRPAQEPSRTKEGRLPPAEIHCQPYGLLLVGWIL